jgi:hypothetical protein
MSMGAAALVNTAAQDNRLDALVLDSLFADWGDTDFAKDYRLPPEWLVPGVPSPERLLAGIHVPVFIIHGTADILTNVEHAQRLYRAANEPKELWINDSGHAWSSWTYPDVYPGKGSGNQTAAPGERSAIAIGRSLIHHGFNKIIYVTGHGSNIKVLDPMLRTLRYETHAFIALYKAYSERDLSLVQDIIENPKEETPGWHCSEMETAQDSFNIILQVGAGTGLLYLLRWYWWRVNAWCEVVAMVTSFGISVAFLIMRKGGIMFSTYQQLALTIAFTSVCWIATAYFGPETDHRTLVDFYRKVHPFGPGWRKIRIEAGVSDVEAAEYLKHENIPLSLLGWMAGCAAIWSSLFTVGNFLYGRMDYAFGLLGVFIVSSAVLIWVIKRVWR